MEFLDKPLAPSFKLDVVEVSRGWFLGHQAGAQKLSHRL
jgi:hypothetical protein